MSYSIKSFGDVKENDLGFAVIFQRLFPAIDDKGKKIHNTTIDP